MQTKISQQNLLLAPLSKGIRERLFSRMEWVELPQGKVIYEPGDTIRHVYFPTDAIIAMLGVTENGASAETLIVGNEGVVGLALLSGGGGTPIQTMVQNGGHAYRLPGQLFMQECNRHGELMQQIFRYTQALITQISQTAVCNRHHCIEQRLCRWLLLSLDRLPGNEFAMTQDLIANMLGVRREGITEAAGKLQGQGVIKYCRGHINVVDRLKLENLSCECYAVVKKETDRLLGQASVYLDAMNHQKRWAS